MANELNARPFNKGSQAERTPASITVMEITPEDFSGVAAATLSLFGPSYVAGDVLECARMRAVTPANGGATSELTVKMGYASDEAGVELDDDAFLTATSVHADASYVSEKSGDGASNASGKSMNHAGRVLITLTSTGGNISLLEVGNILLSIKKIEGVDLFR